MLDADEHRPLVRRDEHAGDLADVRPDEEAPGLARLRIGAEHLVVPEAGVRPGVDRAAGHVRLDPEPAARGHVNAVRRAVAVADDGGTGLCVSRIAAECEEVPLERRLGPVALIRPADDVTVRIW